MKNEMEILEDYIDYLGERDFINSLTVEEQNLYKCQLRETLDFAKYSLCMRLKDCISSVLKGKERKNDEQ